MPGKRLVKSLIAPLAVLLFGHWQPLLAAELTTLFTTPQERRLIDSNRYRDATPQLIETAPVEVDETPLPALVKEEVVQQYTVSGITVSADGSHSVWINSIVYEDGEQLEDSSRIKILTGDEVRVRITAPDGRQYYATSGQTLEVSYLVTVGNQ